MKIRKTLIEFEVEMDGAVFNLRAMSELELEHCNYLLFEMIEMIQAGHILLPPKAVKYILKNCLLDWDGVEDENGKKVKYEVGKEDLLPTKARMGLASDVYIRSQLSEDEKKS